MDDRLVIGFDLSADGDVPCMTIGRRTESIDGLGVGTILNTVTGDRAIELYNELIGRGGNIVIPKEQKSSFCTDDEFRIGDFAWYSITPRQMLLHNCCINKPESYKIIQITASNRHCKVYNTKHGSFTESDIGVTVFHTEQAAIEKRRERGIK